MPKKGRFEYTTYSKEVYTKFCQLHPEVNISFKDWRTVVLTYNSSFSNYLLETGLRVSIASSFGTFAVNKKPIQKSYMYKGVERHKLPVDWKRTKELGYKVYNLNAHTDGYGFCWMWFNKDIRIHNGRIWSFKACRRMSRSITRYLEVNPQAHQLYHDWRAYLKNKNVVLL